MIRHGPAFQKVHEVDVSSAGRFDFPAGIQTIHDSIDHDLQHLTRRCLILPDPVIGFVQVRKIHFLHECTQQADRIVRRDHGFQIEWNF